MTDKSYRVQNPRGGSALVFICDHASNRVPAEFGDLGIPAAELQRHIAWDIGAAAVAEILARRFGAPAVFSEVSRLVVDCNRTFEDASLAPEVSDGTIIPANRNLTEQERRRRWNAYHQPYHAAIEDVVAGKLAGGQTPIIVSIHSMTPTLKGISRPWQIAVCWADDRRLSAPMLEALRARPGIVVGDNEPYRLEPQEDCSVPVHAMRRGLRHLQIEFRQDEIADPAGQRRWAALFGDCLEQVLRALPNSSPRP